MALVWARLKEKREYKKVEGKGKKLIEKGKFSNSDLEVVCAAIEGIGRGHGLLKLPQALETLQASWGVYSRLVSKKALSSYFNALEFLHTIHLDGYSFGQVLERDRITGEGWQHFLRKKLYQRILLSEAWLPKDVCDFEAKISLLQQAIHGKLFTSKKSLFTEITFTTMLL